MAVSFTLTIQDEAKAAEIINNFCYRKNYDQFKNDKETKAQFLKRHLKEWIAGEAAQGKVKANFDENYKSNLEAQID